jgi:hypothetical protein
VFSTDVLPYVVQGLQAFIPSYGTVPSNLSPGLVRQLTQVDYLNLEESCGLLESLCMDVADMRLSLARGLNLPDEHDGVPCLLDMLKFVEYGDYPPHWSEEPEELSARKNGFDRCKAAVIKAIVEVAGEEKNTEVLWDASDPELPGGPFVDRMVHWIREQKDVAEDKRRDDLIACATLSLGNVVRKGEVLVPFKL